MWNHFGWGFHKYKINRNKSIKYLRLKLKTRNPSFISLVLFSYLFQNLKKHFATTHQNKNIFPIHVFWNCITSSYMRTDVHFSCVHIHQYTFKMRLSGFFCEFLTFQIFKSCCFRHTFFFVVFGEVLKKFYCFSKVKLF